MMWILGILALLIIMALLLGRKAGAPTLSETQLHSATRLLAIGSSDTEATWHELGSRTHARRLDLKFDHDDDPKAEATLRLPDANSDNIGKVSNRVVVTLTDTFQTVHVHTMGYVFQVSLRGTGAVVDKQVIIKMMVDTKGNPFGARIENDDDTDAAVGDWIEIRDIKILQVDSSATPPAS